MKKFDVKSMQGSKRTLRSGSYYQPCGAGTAQQMDRV